jgi:hypothetical protein
LRRALVLSLLALPALAGSAAGGARAVPSCRGADLRGVFAVVNGSAGAGGISYDLRLQNRSYAKCFVSGIPSLRLLRASGAALPTKVVPDTPGALTGAKVVLKPGGYAAATARFSPDIPGPGEPPNGPCEGKAFKLRVSPAGGGSLTIAVAPPTPVCEHGRLNLTALVAGKHGPRS